MKCVLIFQPVSLIIASQGQSYILTYLLTYSMVQSPSWEANWFAASQEISRISRNSKVHYRTHKRPPIVSILGQPYPVQIPTSHLLEIHPNIIHPSTPRSPQWSPSLRLTHQDPIHPPLLTHTRHMSSPTAVPSWSCSQAVSKPVWHISLLCAQWKTPDDGQRNCPKHLEFYLKNKFLKFSASSWFYYKNLSQSTVTWTSNKVVLQ